jgi:hypothetical protein
MSPRSWTRGLVPGDRVPSLPCRGVRAACTNTHLAKIAARKGNDSTCFGVFGEPKDTVERTTVFERPSLPRHLHGAARRGAARRVGSAGRADQSVQHCEARASWQDPFVLSSTCDDSVSSWARDVCAPCVASARICTVEGCSAFMHVRGVQVEAAQAWRVAKNLHITKNSPFASTRP